jgi:hypothetical protein
MSNVHVMEESRSLRCDLTNLERLEKGRALAEADADCARIEEEKGRVASQYAAQLKTATSRRHELSAVIRQGYEFRDVNCRVQFVYPDREVLVVRTDTGEVIERRGMNPEELRKAERRAQGNLFPEEPKTEAPAEAAPAALPEAETPKHKRERKRTPTVTDAETPETSAPAAGQADAPVDAQDTEEAAAEPTPAGEGDSPKECSSCGHLLSYHRNENGAPSACWQPDCECQAFTPADDPAAEVTEFADEGPCARRGCGHALCYHNGFTGCQINRCHCKGFVQPDPLGLEEVSNWKV